MAQHEGLDPIQSVGSRHSERDFVRLTTTLPGAGPACGPESDHLKSKLHTDHLARRRRQPIAMLILQMVGFASATREPIRHTASGQAVTSNKEIFLARLVLGHSTATRSVHELLGGEQSHAAVHQILHHCSPSPEDGCPQCRGLHRPRWTGGSLRREVHC